ncbi:inactive serine protease PAMR1 isoform X2 [Amia ocellicauda]|uniref:inactive serine protease PAMR1 isoform X2 n=1 Tax=Amia ocellicauda TaxID=2972642 RepID=UPI003464BF8F
MLSSGRRLASPHEWTHTLQVTSWSTLVFLVAQVSAFPHGYTVINENCPGAEWNIMCRGCCEYDQIRCKCPSQGDVVGYAVPCCRNAENECDPCIIHPGCSIFENCKRCHNGTWGMQDDFFVKGKYCTECRKGWSGGDCMKCGGVINASRGYIAIESYPTNAHCEWTLHVNPAFNIELRFLMLSLEFDFNCRYDYVEVRDGDGVDSRVIGRFCGNERPATIKSSGNSLHVLFVSDGYKSFDGFFAIFEENSACTSSPCLHDGTCFLDSANSFRCACLAGYTGKQCENMVLCRSPLVPVHGSKEGDDLRFGAHVTFRCDTGFTLKGAHKATCQLDGNWSAPTPICVPAEKQCEDLGKPLNGNYLLVYGPGDVLIAVQYFCNTSYTLRGISQLTCLPNGTWSGTKPQCVKVPQKTKCSEPVRLSNGYYHLTPGSGDSPDTVEFFCNNSYALSGNAKRSCQQDGKWSGKQPYCVKVPQKTKCSEPVRLSNGYYHLTPGSGDSPDTVEFFCNNSYALSGNAKRSCQQDGKWSGKQPYCVKACREPKVSDLVRQKVLPPQVPSRTTPVHKLYASSSMGKFYDMVPPTKAPLALDVLPPGYHHVYTKLQYECASPFYQHTGSSHRTCLKTGKWSGRHVTCLPVCGKISAFNQQKLLETRWPWHAAIYRRSVESMKMDSVSEDIWQLICSGALINQRSVVVAAHCVTELGKLHPLKAADIRVVMGKHYRNDAKEPKSLQHLRVSTILVHPNYDPLVLDSDLAMLKLLDKARINEKVLPICLPSAQGGEITALKGYVMGWSILSELSPPDNETTRVGPIQLADVVECEHQYAQNGLSVSITDNMFCGRELPHSFSNICPSDTGGITVLPSSSTTPDSQGDAKVVWQLLGLVSWGYDRPCSPQLYTVYTRATSFKDWIEKNMK